MENNEYNKEFMNHKRKEVHSAIELLEKRIRSARDASTGAIFRTNFGAEASENVHYAHRKFEEVDTFLCEALQKLLDIRQNF